MKTELQLLFEESIKGIKTQLDFEGFKRLIKSKYTPDPIQNNVHTLVYDYLAIEGSITEENEEDFLTQHILFDRIEEEVEEHLEYEKSPKDFVEISRESAEGWLTDFELREIGCLADWIDVDDFCLSDLDGAKEEDLKDIIYYMLDSQGAFSVEYIYYDQCIDYLRREDPSLFRSFEIANEVGYDLTNLNSEILASLHASEASRESYLNTDPIHFENLLIALHRYYEAKSKL